MRLDPAPAPDVLGPPDVGPGEVGADDAADDAEDEEAEQLNKVPVAVERHLEQDRLAGPERVEHLVPCRRELCSRGWARDDGPGGRPPRPWHTRSSAT